MGTEASAPGRTNEEESNPVTTPGEADSFQLGWHILGGIVQPASPFDPGSGYSEDEDDAGGRTGEEEHRPTDA